MDDEDDLELEDELPRDPLLLLLPALACASQFRNREAANRTLKIRLKVFDLIRTSLKV